MPKLTSSLRNIFGRMGYFPVRTGRRAYTFRARDFPPPPPDFKGTLPEWNFLLAHGVLDIPEGPGGFTYLYNAANPYEVRGTTSIDFYENDVAVAIQIQGFFYHYIGFDGFTQANDLVKQIEIESLGYTYIRVDEEDANRDPVYYLREARAGRDHSRFGRGMM